MLSFLLHLYSLIHRLLRWTHRSSSLISRSSSLLLSLQLILPPTCMTLLWSESLLEFHVFSYTASQNSESLRTPAIRKFFRVTSDVFLTLGTSTLNFLKYSFKVSLGRCLIFSKVLVRGTKAKDTLNCVMKSYSTVMLLSVLAFFLNIVFLLFFLKIQYLWRNLRLLTLLNISQLRLLIL